MSDILTLGEAAQLLRCSKGHLQNVLRGKVANVPPLPCIRIGRRILFRREALEHWLEASESLPEEMLTSAPCRDGSSLAQER